MLWFLLAGDDPSGDLDADLERHRISDKHAAIVDVIRRCTKNSPTERYQTVRDLVRGLDADLDSDADFDAAVQERARRSWAEAQRLHEGGNVEGAISAADQALALADDFDHEFRGVIQSERDKWSAEMGSSDAVRRLVARKLVSWYYKYPAVTVFGIIVVALLVVVSAFARVFFDSFAAKKGELSAENIGAPVLQPDSGSEDSSGESTGGPSVAGQEVVVGQETSATPDAEIGGESEIAGIRKTLIAAHGSRWPQYVPQKERIAYLQAELLGKRSVANVDFSVTDAKAWRPSLEFLNLRKVILDQSNLDSAVLDGAYLLGSSLRSVKMKHVFLRGANLGLADFRPLDDDALSAEQRMTNMYGADLSSTPNKKTSLKNADLRGAYVKYVNFRGADLSGALLLNARILRADFRNTNVEVAQICETLNWESAFLPGDEVDDDGVVVKDGNFRREARAKCR